MSVADAARGPSPQFIQAVLKARRIDASLPPAVWLELIPALLAFERRRARVRHRYGWVAFLLFALAVTSCGVGKARDLGALVGAGWTVFALAVLTVLFRTLLAGGPPLPARDLSRCLAPLVALLAHDMEEHRPLTLRLDLRETIKSATPLADYRQLPKPYPNPRHTSVKERLLRSERFSGLARLRDGGELRWRVTDLIRERRIRKRGSSGKIKLATKYKVKRQLEVRLSVRSNRLRPGADQELPPGVRLRAGERRSVLRARAERELAGPPPPLDFQEILDLMTAAFRPAGGSAQKGAGHGSV